MSTLRDLRDLASEVEGTISLCGSDPLTVQEWRQKCAELGSTICAELGVAPEVANLLPMETELGPRAEVLFISLKAWTVAKHA
jgi:hypothetical protein